MAKENFEQKQAELSFTKAREINRKMRQRNEGKNKCDYIRIR